MNKEFVFFPALFLCAAMAVAQTDYVNEIEKWRSDREANLKKESGWLTVAGLSWLKAGTNSVGAGEKFDVRLTDNFKQGRFGQIDFENGKAILKVESGVDAQSDGKSITGPVELVSDEQGKPTEIRTGTQTFFLIKREERYGIRLKDSNSEARRNFGGLHWFPVDETYKVTARRLAAQQSSSVNRPPGRPLPTAQSRDPVAPIVMMHEFLAENRGELIERCRMKVAKRSAPRATEAELDHGITLFLDQIIKTLQAEESSQPKESRRMSGPSGGAEASLSEMGVSAREHGRELLQHGFTIEQVVHDYGDLCQSVTDLAVEMNMPISNDEFRTLNRCLDNAIAVAATEFNAQRDNLFADKDARANERLGFFAHELRNHLNSATLALTAIKAGSVGLTGATGAVLDRSLVGLRKLIDRSLSEARVSAGIPAQRQLFSLADFIAEIQLSASLEAQVNKCNLTVSYVDSKLAVDADRELLLSAVGNLLQNAFKFSHPQSDVLLTIHAQGDRILIDIEDHCGGLPSGDLEKMFLPYTQAGTNRTGLGLGLSISRRSVEANSGTLTVRDLPDRGCVFTIDLPRHAMATTSSSSRATVS